MTHETLTTILVASDLSDEADLALATGARLAERSGARLHLVHAVAPPPAPYWEFRTSALDTQRWAREGREKLAAQATRVLGASDPASQRATVESPYKAIVDTAGEVDADLIVLGPHRKRAGAAVAGTTADRVIRTAAVPVLVANGALPDGPPRVRVALDLSEPAREALRLAAHWLPSLVSDGGHVALEVMHVAPESTAFGLGLPDVPELGRRLEEEVETVFSGGVPSAIDVTTRIERSDRPAEEIVKRDGHGPDLVVVATRGYGAVGRALVGGIASRVIRRAEDVPVLLVPPGLWRDE